MNYIIALIAGLDPMIKKLVISLKAIQKGCSGLEKHFCIFSQNCLSFSITFFQFYRLLVKKSCIPEMLILISTICDSIKLFFTDLLPNAMGASFQLL